MLNFTCICLSRARCTMRAVCICVSFTEVYLCLSFCDTLDACGVHDGQRQECESSSVCVCVYVYVCMCVFCFFVFLYILA